MKKIEPYKNSLIKYGENEKIKGDIIIDFKLTEIDYIIGVLFLAKMNIYCKLNNFSAHGYHLAYALSIYFNEINKAIYNKTEIDNNIISYFWISFSNNLIYLKEKTENCLNITEQINKNITNNIYKFTREISVNLNKINILNKKLIKNLDTTKEKSIIMIENKNIEKNIYSSFFYILLISSKFFGSGEYKDPNLERLAEYYTNTFMIYNESLLRKLKIIKNNKTTTNSETNISTNINNKTELLDMFINSQLKLTSSLLELNLNSETLDEILNYLNDKINELIS